MHHYLSQVFGFFSFFFTLNLLVVNFALLKLKSFVPNKSSGCLGDFFFSWVIFPRADAVPGNIPYRGLQPKERKKERKKEIASCEKIRLRPGLLISLVWHGVVSISLHS